MIKNNKKIMKTIVFSLSLAALMLTADNLSAQDRGLFNMGKSSTDSKYSGNKGGLLRGDVTINDNDDEGGITNYGVGEPVPVGSGIAILLTAGMGYVAFKKKEDE